MTRDELFRIFEESNSIKLNFIQYNTEKLIKVIETIIATIMYGNKILIFGNGGSAADAQHMASEFVNRLNFDRDPLPAIALTTDSSVITSIGNDFNYNDIFSKQIKAIGKSGDLAFGITTSGNSENVVFGIIEAKNIGLKTICLTGNDGGIIKDIANLSLIVHSNNTQRIQETHITIIHTICEMVEKLMFKENKK